MSTWTVKTPAFPLAALAWVAMVMAPAVPCKGFGEDGHKAFYGAALALLRADDKERCAISWPSYTAGGTSKAWGAWRGASAVYPDAIVVYHTDRMSLSQLGLDALITEYERLSGNRIDKATRDAILAFADPEHAAVDYALLLQNSLNSADHYYNPGEPGRTAPTFKTDTKFREALASLVAHALIDALFKAIEVPDQLRKLIEPKLLEPVSHAILAEIEKHCDDENSIFSGPARSFSEYLQGAKGTVQIVGADGTGYDAVSAADFYLNSEGKGGSRSPSSVAPNTGFIPLARSAKSSADAKFAEALVSLGVASHYIADLHSPGHTDWDSWYLAAHSAYDGYGDKYLSSISLSGLQPELVSSLQGARTNALDRLKKAADTSRALWQPNKSALSPPDSKELHEHFRQGVALMAGIIDWAFSGAVEKPDGPYSRDATGFLGMAVALSQQRDARSGLITPKDLADRKMSGSLGGVDQDDYFPVTGNKSQFVEVTFEYKLGQMLTPGVAAYDSQGKVIAPSVCLPGQKSLKLDLGSDPPSEFLLRVSSADGSVFGYTITFPPDVQMVVEAEAAVVKSGKPVKFTVKVADKDGKPVTGVTVGVEDPLAEQTVVLPVGSDGSFSYSSDTPLTKPGVYAFVFLCSRAPEQVYTIAVVDESYTTVSLPRFQVPLGNWGTIGESFDAKPEVFTTVTRTTTGQSPPEILSPPYAPPSTTSQMIAAAKTLAEDILNGSVEEFTSSPVNVGAVGVAVATCPFPEIAVTKPVCAGSVAYLQAAAVEAVAKTVFKKAIDLSDLTSDKESWKKRVDEAFFVYDVFQLDPKAGPKSAKGVEQTLNMLAIQWDAPQVIFQSLPAQSADTPASSGYAIVTLANGDVLGITARGAQPPSDKGMLDVVVLIDKSGSMSDDIESVQREVDKMLGDIASTARQQNISLQVGLVMFSYTGTANVFETCPLSDNVDSARKFVVGLNPQSVGGDEDLYSALMHAMNKPVEGKQIEMGWREGAAKITIPITDEAPKEDNFTLLDVAKTAEALDPVHMYPLVMPKTPLSWLDPAVHGMNKLAAETGGEAVKVQDAKALPQAIVATVKLAIRRHKEEVWRKDHPPYVLYGVGGGIGAVVVIALIVLLIKGMARPRRPVLATAAPVDPRLTGQVTHKANPDD